MITSFAHLKEKKQRGEKIVTISLSTAPLARIADSLMDMILVGDSLAMALLNLSSTRGVDLATMIRHTKAVKSVCKQAPVIIDMPYKTYDNKQEALDNASLALEQSKADGVKLEGGREKAPTVKHLTSSGIAVCGHIGLLPQSIEDGGAFVRKGKEENAHQNLLEDAKALESAGAFAIVLEAILEPIARDIAQQISIPTIGIGASPACDGQILVAEDILGLRQDIKKPKFVKEFSNIEQQIQEGFTAYANEVKSQQFPTHEHCYLDKK